MGIPARKKWDTIFIFATTWNSTAVFPIHGSIVKVKRKDIQVYPAPPNWSVVPQLPRKCAYQCVDNNDESWLLFATARVCCPHMHVNIVLGYGAIFLLSNWQYKTSNTCNDWNAHVIHSQNWITCSFTWFHPTWHFGPSRSIARYRFVRTFEWRARYQQMFRIVSSHSSCDW